jgi:hypothetical protein
MAGKMMRALVYRNLGLPCEVEIVDSIRVVAAAAARSPARSRSR